METWLDRHLEEFVRPQLGSIPNVDLKNQWVKIFDAKQLFALNAVWLKTRVLAKGRTILLPGRDVYLFEVIARMRGDHPTIFRPDISMEVAPYVTEDYKETLCLDTGYKGSVPKAMEIPNWVLVRYSGGASRPTPEDIARYQVFPKAKLSGPIGSLSGNLEGCPKYWVRGMMRREKTDTPWKKGTPIVQTIDHANFKTAAMLTMLVARSVRKVRSLLGRIA